MTETDFTMTINGAGVAGAERRSIAQLLQTSQCFIQHGCVQRGRVTRPRKPKCHGIRSR